MNDALRPLSIAIALVLILAASAPSTGQDAADVGREMPTRVASGASGESTPLWIASDQVTRQEAGDRTVDTSLIPESELQLIESYFSTKAQVEAKQGGEPNLCPIFLGKSMIEHREWSPRSTFAELVQGARAIYRGVTTGNSTGFYKGRPGSLLRIDIDSPIFRNAEALPIESAFVYLNTGIVEFGEQVVCLNDFSFSALPPKNGIEVLLFVFFEPDNLAGNFFGIDAVEIPLD